MSLRFAAASACTQSKSQAFSTQNQFVAAPLLTPAMYSSSSVDSVSASLNGHTLRAMVHGALSFSRPLHDKNKAVLQTQGHEDG